MNIIPLICSIAAATFTVLSMPIIPAIMVTYGVSVMAHVIVGRYCEKRADDFAIRHSSQEELKGGIRFMKGVREISELSRSAGYHNIDLTHPSPDERKQKIERSLNEPYDSALGADPHRGPFSNLIVQNFVENFEELEELKGNDRKISFLIKVLEVTHPAASFPSLYQRSRKAMGAVSLYFEDLDISGKLCCF